MNPSQAQAIRAEIAQFVRVNGPRLDHDTARWCMETLDAAAGVLRETAARDDGAMSYRGVCLMRRYRLELLEAKLRLSSARIAELEESAARTCRLLGAARLIARRALVSKDAETRAGALAVVSAILSAAALNIPRKEASDEVRDHPSD